MEFKENKCSVKARKVFVEHHNISLDIWYDKHYLDRYQHGDENGKRDGIDPSIIGKLIRKSIHYLIVFSAAIKNFNFLNPTKTQNPIRIVLRDSNVPEILNVAIEAHIISPTNYEITVKTAMLIENFKMATGQYMIDSQGDAISLLKFENKTFIEVFSF
ncbi:MAG: hypothetical protein KA319_09555 [Ferruginibacter sp.]|nr:hypothetical protein [Ferruginibacter sp.]